MAKKGEEKAPAGGNRTKGTEVLYVEIDTALGDELRGVMAKYGDTKRQVVEEALRRHFKYPPERKVEPLPDSPHADK